MQKYLHKQLLPTLVTADIDAIRNKAAIERAVVDVLRELRILPSAPKPKPSIRVVADEISAADD